jgi:malate dehydrogenase (oxaloacetate-decarboxylating)
MAGGPAPATERTTVHDEHVERAEQPAREALRLHPFYRGKVQMLPKCPITSDQDFAIWYTPGVAAPCREIARSPELVYEHTNKANIIAVVSDGSRVLGLGNIGPEAGLPVMEGKALLFKYLGGIDAVPLCVRASEPDDIVRVVQMIEPSFGGINLEDIAQPQCFRVLDALRGTLGIPVWHDDQQGSATVLLAGLLGALKVVGKGLGAIRIAMIGMGAANVASYRLLKAAGIEPQAVVACDTGGTLHRGRADIEAQQEVYLDKWQVCTETNAEKVVGGIPEALRAADVCIAFSQPGPEVIRPEWIRGMAAQAIVFACANPVPEIWPWAAKAAGARIVATGRSDFANQLNNSLGFPGIFRGVLDVRARTVTDGMAIAAADALAGLAEGQGLSTERILPGMGEIEVAARVAAATGAAAQAQGVARRQAPYDQLYRDATATILHAREATRLLVESGLIPPPPSAA